MNIFYEGLPCYVEIGGKKYEIITDFREWIRFLDMIKSELSPRDKFECIMDMFVNERPLIKDSGDFSKITDAFKSFLSMEKLSLPKSRGAVSKGAGTGSGNISYTYDAVYIIPAFKRDYGIDLIEIEYLHWWKFYMLLCDLDEKNRIKEYIYYRSVDLSTIKDKEERKRIGRIREMVKLPDEGFVSDGDIGNAFS